jgi:hypothetical protein
MSSGDMNEMDGQELGGVGHGESDIFKFDRPVFRKLMKLVPIGFSDFCENHRFYFHKIRLGKGAHCMRNTSRSYAGTSCTVD